MAKRAAVVLDTHVWFWLVTGISFSEPARKVIAQAASSSSVLVPAISVWELAMLENKGKITLTRAMKDWVNDALTLPGLTLAPLTPEVAVESCILPGKFHQDPADRMIVATARIENAVLITRDQRILDYAAHGYLAVVPA